MIFFLEIYKEINFNFNSKKVYIKIYTYPSSKWASQVAQLVKNPPAMQETWVPSLGWEDHLEKGTATRSSILASRIPWNMQPRGSRVTTETLSLWASQVALVVKNPPANAGDVRNLGLIPGLGGSLEEEIATHSSILAWRVPWTEEPGGLQSLGSQRVDTTEAT